MTGKGVIHAKLTKSDGLEVRKAIPNGRRADAAEETLSATGMCMIIPSGQQALLLFAGNNHHRSRRMLRRDLEEVMTHAFKTCTDIPSRHASGETKSLHIIA